MKAVATRTVVVESERLPRRVFKVFVELEGMYRNMVEQLTLYAVRNNIRSFTKLKAMKYREMRNLYPQLPSHYAYTACQDASTRVKSFLRLKKRGLTDREYPEVRSVSIWLDDHLWRMDGLTQIRVATHSGWITVGIEPHRQFWKYLNRGWSVASEARVKLDRRERRLVLYVTFKKEVEIYKPRGFIAVDVNENSMAVLVDGTVVLLETDLEKLVLGYYYRRKRVQEKYDKLYGVACRTKRKVLRKLKEKEKKSDARWKIANLVIRKAAERGYGIVLERLGKKPAENMASRIKDRQLRHRIYQASFRGVQRAIEEKAKEYGVPVVYVDPRNSSKTCPLHGAEIRYSSRVGICGVGGEKWHRDALACWNLLLRALRGDGSRAPSHPGLNLDGGCVLFSPTATHEPTGIPKSLWARWKTLDMNKHQQIEMNIQGQTAFYPLTKYNKSYRRGSSTGNKTLSS